MYKLTILLLTSAIALPAIAADTPACSDLDGWNAGRLGQETNKACTQETYGEAYRLGQSLWELRQQRAALDPKIAAGGEDAGVLRRRQRQIDVDIEAIRGIATVRHWPDDAASASREGAQP
ncbi:MAG: hypothetical protein KDI69_00165 [Xanthomonadales bacterium]|nr:hypothetical protein [Xanthomonadales bacterium]